MKIPSVKRIVTNDYDPKYSDIVGKLADTLNYEIEIFNTTLTQQVSLGDNVLCDVKTLSITVDGSGNPTTTPSFTIVNKNITSIQGMQVIKAVNAANTNSYVTGAPFLSYSVQQKQGQNTSSITVAITNCTGLPANTAFNLTVVIYG